VWSSAAELAPAKRPTMSGLLKAWPRLGRVASITPQDRNLLRTRFVDAFTRLLSEKDKSTFSPADFGVSNVRELADLFVTVLDRVGYARASRSKIRRMRSHLVGELLEALVRNSRDLQPGLRLMAEAQLANFRRPGAELVNARGKKVDPPARFGGVTTAIDVAVIAAPDGDAIRSSTRYRSPPSTLLCRNVPCSNRSSGTSASNSSPVPSVPAGSSWTSFTSASGSGRTARPTSRSSWRPRSKCRGRHRRPASRSAVPRSASTCGAATP
jgi:hypothetical protein